MIKISQAQNLNKVLGDNYFNHLAYAKAIKFYEKALRKDSTNLHILSHLAQSYKNSGHFCKAEELYDLLRAEKDTSSMEAYAHLLIYNNKYGRADRLITQYNLVLPTYKKQLIDSLMSAEPDYEVSITGINTEYSDFRPCFLNDNLIFSSARDTSKNEYEWNGQPYLSLFQADISENGHLSDVRRFTKVDSRYHISSFQYVRRDRLAFFTMNNTNAFSSSKDGNNEVNLGIYLSKLERGIWQKPEPVEKVSSKDYNSAHPFFSPHNDRLYFSSNRPGGFGGSDIYYADVYTDGMIGDPVNCGESINTPGDEVYPFVLPNGVLYFSSNGHPGLGGLDVFCATNEDDLFGEVQNLGVPVNSSRDDFSFILMEDQITGYLSSNRSGGVGDDDIYLVKNTRQIEANAIAKAEAERRAKEEALKKAKLAEEQKKKNQLAQKNKAIGTNVPLGSEIMTPEKTVLPGLTPGKELTIESITEFLDAMQPESSISDKNQLKDLKFRLYNIIFDFNSWDIKAEAAKELDKLADLMKKHSSMTIELSSHTDCRGNNAYNKVLSQARADAALKYILKQGISINRIEAVGDGEQKPVNHCIDGVDCPEVLHQENRRVEVLITGF
ncbi:MAG: OmpA family protein [Marinilabiliaceae bacterium]|nr:OmpA family protein [Marinilabiliaceae bacterium]